MPRYTAPLSIAVLTCDQCDTTLHWTGLINPLYGRATWQGWSVDPRVDHPDYCPRCAEWRDR